MQTWKRNFKQPKDTDIRQLALAYILNWTVAHLHNKTPHEEIIKGIEERMAMGLSAPASSMMQEQVVSEESTTNDYPPTSQLAPPTSATPATPATSPLGSKI